MKCVKADEREEGVDCLPVGGCMVMLMEARSGANRCQQLTSVTECETRWYTDDQ